MGATNMDKVERVTAALVTESAITLVPGAGILKAAFEAFFDGDFSTRFNRAVRECLQDQVHDLETAVRKLQAALDEQGRKLDELDPIGYRRLMEEFVKSIANSITPAQRSALVNATARLFDPSLGPLSLRHHWLHVVQSLSDAEIETMLLMRDGAIWLGGADHVVIGTHHGVTQYKNPDLSVARGAARSEPVDFANITALHVIVAQLNRRDPPLVQGATESDGSTMGGDTFHVTPPGEMVLKLIAPLPESRASADEGPTL
jgi:hypothetical protein